MTVYNTGKHKWKHGQIVSWHRNRNPERWLLGPCPRCGSVTSNYGGAYSCHNDYCMNSAMRFVCSPDKTPEWWDTDINVQLDGDSWCATAEGFVNLQESPVGFGDTPQEAVEELKKELLTGRRETMEENKCVFCGTINDAHHSAECIDTGGKGYPSQKPPEVGRSGSVTDYIAYPGLSKKESEELDWLLSIKLATITMDGHARIRRQVKKILRNIEAI